MMGDSAAEEAMTGRGAKGLTPGMTPKERSAVPTGEGWHMEVRNWRRKEV